MRFFGGLCVSSFIYAGISGVMRGIFDLCGIVAWGMGLSDAIQRKKLP